MTAQEARNLAAANKLQMDQQTLLKKSDLLDQQTNSLREHFNRKIEQAVKQGKFETEPMEFDLGRFPDDAVRSVAQELRAQGYHIESDKNSAFQRVKYKITWSV